MEFVIYNVGQIRNEEKAIVGSKFNVYDEDKNLVNEKELITNSEGRTPANLKLYEGKYYIEQTSVGGDFVKKEGLERIYFDGDEVKIKNDPKIGDNLKGSLRIAIEAKADSEYFLIKGDYKHLINKDLKTLEKEGAFRVEPDKVESPYESLEKSLFKNLEVIYKEEVPLTDSKGKRIDYSVFEIRDSKLEKIYTQAAVKRKDKDEYTDIFTVRKVVELVYEDGRFSNRFNTSIDVVGALNADEKIAKTGINILDGLNSEEVGVDKKSLESKLRTISGKVVEDTSTVKNFGDYGLYTRSIPLSYSDKDGYSVYSIKYKARLKEGEDKKEVVKITRDFHVDSKTKDDETGYVYTSLPSFYLPYNEQIIDEKELLNIDVKKYESIDGVNTKKTLSDVEFTMFNLMETIEIDKQKTNEEGLARFVDVKDGEYIIRETKHKYGYKTAAIKYRIKVEEGVVVEMYQVGIKDGAEETKVESKEVIFLNEKVKSEVDFIKKDELTGEPLEGVVFTLYKKDKRGRYKEISTENELVTNGKGEFRIVDLDKGSYKIKEVKPKEGYELEKGKEYTFIVKDINGELFIYKNECAQSEITKPVVITNKKMGVGLKIIKTGEVVTEDSQDVQKPLENVRFELSAIDVEGFEPIRANTDQDGRISFSGLKPGRYILKEVRTVEGYIPKTIMVTIYDNGNVDYGEATERKITRRVYRGGKDAININSIDFETSIPSDDREAKKIRPNLGEYIDLDINVSIDEEISKGETFELKIGNSLTSYGAMYLGSMLMKDHNGQTVAMARCEQGPKVNTHIFVALKNIGYETANIRGKLFIDRAVERKNIYKEIEVYTNEDSKKSITLNIDYGGFKETQLFITEVDKARGTFNAELYFRPAQSDYIASIDKDVTVGRNCVIKNLDKDNNSLYEAFKQGYPFENYFEEIELDGMTEFAFSDEFLEDGDVVFMEIIGNLGKDFEKNPIITLNSKDEYDVSGLINRTEATILIENFCNEKEFKKIGDQEKPLKGAQFKIIGDNQEVMRATSDKNGIIKFVNIKPGVYELTEEVAPVGYVLKSGVLARFEVKEDRSIVDLDEEVYEIKNEELRIPETGVDTVVPFISLGLLLLIISTNGIFDKKV